MNKAWVVALVSVIAAPAAADDRQIDIHNALVRLGRSFDFTQDRDTKDWVPASSMIVDGKATCTGEIAKLAELEAPGDSKVRLDGPAYGLEAGDHTLDEILPICERVVAFGKTKPWEFWAYEAMREYPRVTKKTPFNAKYFENCISSYEDMMKAGIPPTYKVAAQMVADNDGKMVRWEGTVEELRQKWCDGGLKNANAERERRDAPYKKALKGDKLSLALSWRAMYLPGGTLTENPAQMAKAEVWFTDSSPGLVCLKKGTPTVHELTRYEFSGDKIAKTSTSKHCGNPPASAFR